MVIEFCYLFAALKILLAEVVFGWHDKHKVLQKDIAHKRDDIQHLSLSAYRAKIPLCSMSLSHIP